MLRTLLVTLLLAVSAAAAEVPGKWSGSANTDAGHDPQSLFIILTQDGNKLGGSGGPSESEQHALQNGQVQDDRVTFEVPAGKGTVFFELKIAGDELTGTVRFEGENGTLTGKVSLKRVAPGKLPEVSPLSRTLSPAAMQEDFRILRAALEEGHPGIYRFTSKPELDSIFGRAAKQLDRPMSVLAFYRIVAPTVAAIKCGHTAARLEQGVGSVPLLPLDVRVLNRQVFVFHDHSESGILTGAQIQSINGVDISKILDTILASVHGDGDSRTAGPSQLARNFGFARQLYLLTGLESPFQVQYTLNGKAGKAALDGLSMARMQTPGARGVTKFTLLEGNVAGVLKIAGFGDRSDTGKPLREFFQDVFTALHDKNIPNLIIDVRNNGGGEDDLGKRLFAYMVSEPFPYYRDLIVNKLSFDFAKYSPRPFSMPEDVKKTMKKGDDGKYHYTGHPNWGTQQPLTPYFAGKVLVLMNGGSFSTTCEFLSTLHHHHRATFIGEETGGGYYGNTSGISFPLVLPNSKIIVPMQLTGYYMAIEGYEHGSRGIQPDIPVEYSIADILAGKDKEMEVALGQIAPVRQ